jgi:hypothetical protein
MLSVFEFERRDPVLDWNCKCKKSVRKIRRFSRLCYFRERFRFLPTCLANSTQSAEVSVNMGELSQTRFTAGKTDYLEVLTNETNTFTAELNLAQALGNELLALVQLYQALGGGWQQ